MKYITLRKVLHFTHKDLHATHKPLHITQKASHITHEAMHSFKHMIQICTIKYTYR